MNVSQQSESVEKRPINASIIKTYFIFGYPTPTSTWTFTSRSSKHFALANTTERLISRNETAISIEISTIKEEYFGIYKTDVRNNISVLQLQFELLPSGKYFGIR